MSFVGDMCKTKSAYAQWLYVNKNVAQRFKTELHKVKLAIDVN
jgi:hypothetical protein